jgi:predicted RNA binding protein YcfA (HicA-like mRNA interferase family)
MSKLRVLSGREVCAILAEHGFFPVRQRGSHIIMQLRLPHTTITVPVPNHRELDRGTLRGIIRQSGLNRDLFETD